MINTSYFIPLLKGEWFEFSSYATTHYKHSLTSWMHRKACATLLTRDINKHAQYHQMPTFEYSGSINCKEYNQLLYDQPIMMSNKNVMKTTIKRGSPLTKYNL